MRPISARRFPPWIKRRFTSSTARRVCAARALAKRCAAWALSTSLISRPDSKAGRKPANRSRNSPHDWRRKAASARRKAPTALGFPLCAYRFAPTALGATHILLEQPVKLRRGADRVANDEFIPHNCHRQVGIEPGAHRRKRVLQGKARKSGQPGKTELAAGARRVAKLDGEHWPRLRQTRHLDDSVKTEVRHLERRAGSRGNHGAH